jgi:hypothetical protein
MSADPLRKKLFVRLVAVRTEYEVRGKRALRAGRCAYVAYNGFVIHMTAGGVPPVKMKHTTFYIFCYLLHLLSIPDGDSKIFH